MLYYATLRYITPHYAIYNKSGYIAQNACRSNVKDEKSKTLLTISYYLKTLKMSLKQRLKMPEGQEVKTIGEGSDSQIRKVRQVIGSDSRILVLPREQVKKLGIRRGDYAKISIVEDRKLLVEIIEM